MGNPQGNNGSQRRTRSTSRCWYRLCADISLAVYKCDLRPPRPQRYLRTLWLVHGPVSSPSRKLDKLQYLQRKALDAGCLPFRNLQQDAVKHTSLNVVIRPEPCGPMPCLRCCPTRTSQALVESTCILHWLRRRREPCLWPIPRGGDFPARVDIDSKEFCARQPEALRRVQVLSNVDHQSVVGAFKTRRAKDPRDTCAVGTISGGLRILLDAEWILTASNDIADPILPRL